MISLEVDAAQVASEMNSFLLNIKQMVNPSVIEEITKGIFTITGESFVSSADRYARANPKKMHHVYEWGKLGDPEGRLFTLKRSSVLNGTLVIGVNFLPSRLPVPVAPELLNPGPTGKVVTSRSIFADKARVMEEGNPVTFTAKKILSFVGSNGLVFVRPGTQINILSPGGSQAKGSFSEFLLTWYTENSYAVIENSGFYEKISNDVSIALGSKNANIRTVKTAVINSIASMDLDKEIIV